MGRVLLPLLFFFGFVAVLVWTGPFKHPFVALRLAFEDPPETLLVPVIGVPVKALRDTWGAARDGGRTHQGIDIFAPKGTPVRSTTRGIVLRVGQNRLGGNVIWIFGPGAQRHYYAHLDRFGDFGAGDLVMPGDIVGYVGNTGNARGTRPHLHYGVYASGAGAINPFPFLQGRS
jgi:murein DD-endopeptidase MepM/ murein hydrolase activator NlpD